MMMMIKIMIIEREKLICIPNSLLNLSIWPAFTCMREHGWVGSHWLDQKIIIYLDRGLDHRTFFVPRTDAHHVDWQTRSLENGTDVIAENQDSNYLRNRHWENTKCHGMQCDASEQFSRKGKTIWSDKSSRTRKLNLGSRSKSSDSL